MKYRYTEREDFSDYASGRVLLSVPGQPAFPVRLASEIFQRCVAIQQQAEIRRRYMLYDPCCGGATMLTTVGLLHGEQLSRVIGSDIDMRMLEVAEQNLDLLTPNGMANRIKEIDRMLTAYGKESHAEALASAKRLQTHLQAVWRKSRVRLGLFQADAMQGANLAANLDPIAVDIVIADIPYGRYSAWQASGGLPDNPGWQLLEGLLEVLAPQAVVAVAANKGQKIEHGVYRRVERLRLGKRQVTFLQPH